MQVAKHHSNEIPNLTQISQSIHDHAPKGGHTQAHILMSIPLKLPLIQTGTVGTWPFKEKKHSILWLSKGHWVHSHLLGGVVSISPRCCHLTALHLQLYVINGSSRDH